MRKERLADSQYAPLVHEAIAAADNAYVPYSGFHVGAALLDKDGKVWTGCNIESASYTPTNCAERTAMFKAVSEGVKDFQAIAIIGRDHLSKEITESMTAPCGVCRQVLAEFCAEDFEIVLANAKGDLNIYRLEEILPLAFTKTSLDDARQADNS